VIAVRSTKSQISISVVDSASYGISSSIVPESFIDLHVEVAVISAGCIGGKLRIFSSAGVVYNGAVSFTRRTTEIVSVWRSVSAVNIVVRGDGCLRVVESASKRVDGGIDEEISDRECRADSHTFVEAVQSSRSHSWIARSSGTLGE